MTDYLLAWGNMHSADFDEKTLTIAIDGDMPRVAKGRYVVVDARKFDSILRQAQLWQQQEASRA